MSIIILNWQWPLWEGDQEVVKRSSRDEPMWVVTHLLTTLSYVYLKLAKTLFFFLSFMFFLQQNRRTRGQNRFCPEAWGWGE
jgi:hypothetical protein